MLTAIRPNCVYKEEDSLHKNYIKYERLVDVQGEASEVHKSVQKFHTHSITFNIAQLQHFLIWLDILFNKYKRLSHSHICTKQNWRKLKQIPKR